MYYLPPRLLNLNVIAITPFAFTTTGMGNGDPNIGLPYQWTVTFNVSTQSTSSLPGNFAYAGNDIVNGDWMADLQQGLATRIVQIVSQNPNQVTAICEDVDSFNTYADPSGSGNGIGGTGAAYLFTLNDEGLPILGPMTSFASSLIQNVAWQMDLHSRFQYRNYARTFYRVNQPGHNFAVGDVLGLSPLFNSVTQIVGGIYGTVTANTAAVTAIAGQVNSTSVPTPDWFTYRPNGRLVTDLDPVLPGLPGDLIYLTLSGLSNVAPTLWATPLYLQLEVASSGLALNRGIDTAGSLGYACKTYVVADQPAATATLPLTNSGDQVMIDNSGAGEWTHYLVHQGALRPITTQDSARVDAETLDVTMTPATLLQNVVVNNITMRGLFMGNVSANRAVTIVNVQVTAPFDANAVVSVGSRLDSELIIPNALINLTTLGAYAYTPTVVFTAPYTALYAFVDYAGTSIGNAVITVSYV